MRICLVCQNIDCKSRGSEQLMKEFQKRVAARGLTDVEVKPYMCFGACQEGPNIVLYPEKNWYAKTRLLIISPAVPMCSASTPSTHRLKSSSINSWTRGSSSPWKASFSLMECLRGEKD
ncbi:MAG: (2Fe-2S) ferredoxin domain-containing protein [Deltaproteobacteria bacterium]|nr:(2Fe-2S) ferredoxin domain-containing protein [Deltaproteobacteria bacterium]